MLLMTSYISVGIKRYTCYVNELNVYITIYRYAYYFMVKTLEIINILGI